MSFQTGRGGTGTTTVVLQNPLLQFQQPLQQKSLLQQVQEENQYLSESENEGENELEGEEVFTTVPNEIQQQLSFGPMKRENAFINAVNLESHINEERQNEILKNPLTLDDISESDANDLENYQPYSLYPISSVSFLSGLIPDNDAAYNFSYEPIQQIFFDQKNRKYMDRQNFLEYFFPSSMKQKKAGCKPIGIRKDLLSQPTIVPEKDLSPGNFTVEIDVLDTGKKLIVQLPTDWTRDQIINFLKTSVPYLKSYNLDQLRLTLQDPLGKILDFSDDLVGEDSIADILNSFPTQIYQVNPQSYLLNLKIQEKRSTPHRAVRSTISDYYSNYTPVKGMTRLRQNVNASEIEKLAAAKKKREEDIRKRSNLFNVPYPDERALRQKRNLDSLISIKMEGEEPINPKETPQQKRDRIELEKQFEQNKKDHLLEQLKILANIMSGELILSPKEELRRKGYISSLLADPAYASASKSLFKELLNKDNPKKSPSEKLLSQELVNSNVENWLPIIIYAQGMADESQDIRRYVNRNQNAIPIIDENGNIIDYAFREDEFLIPEETIVDLSVPFTKGKSKIGKEEIDEIQNYNPLHPENSCTIGNKNNSSNQSENYYSHIQCQSCKKWRLTDPNYPLATFRIRENQQSQPVDCVRFGLVLEYQDISDPLEIGKKKLEYVSLDQKLVISTYFPNEWKNIPVVSLENTTPLLNDFFFIEKSQENQNDWIIRRDDVGQAIIPDINQQTNIFSFKGGNLFDQNANPILYYYYQPNEVYIPNRFKAIAYFCQDVDGKITEYPLEQSQLTYEPTIWQCGNPSMLHRTFEEKKIIDNIAQLEGILKIDDQNILLGENLPFNERQNIQNLLNNYKKKICATEEENANEIEDTWNRMLENEKREEDLNDYFDAEEKLIQTRETQMQNILRQRPLNYYLAQPAEEKLQRTSKTVKKTLGKRRDVVAERELEDLETELENLQHLQQFGLSNQEQIQQLEYAIANAKQSLGITKGISRRSKKQTNPINPQNLFQNYDLNVDYELQQNPDLFTMEEFQNQNVNANVNNPLLFPPNVNFENVENQFSTTLNPPILSAPQNILLLNTPNVNITGTGDSNPISQNAITGVSFQNSSLDQNTKTNLSKKVNLLHYFFKMPK